MLDPGLYPEVSVLSAFLCVDIAVLQLAALLGCEPFNLQCMHCELHILQHVIAERDVSPHAVNVPWGL